MLYFKVNTDAGEGFYDFMIATEDKESALTAAVRFLKDDGVVPVIDGNYEWSNKADPYKDPIELDAGAK